MTFMQILRTRSVSILSTASKVLGASVIAFALFSSPSAAAAKQVEKSAVAQTRVSINSSNADVLANVLTGVGLKKAQAIVDWRKENGKFRSIDQLALVKGIGEATIEKNRSKLTL